MPSLVETVVGSFEPVHVEADPGRDHQAPQHDCEREGGDRPTTRASAPPRPQQWQEQDDSARPSATTPQTRRARSPTTGSGGPTARTRRHAPTTATPVRVSDMTNPSLTYTPGRGRQPGRNEPDRVGVQFRHRAPDAPSEETDEQHEDRAEEDHRVAVLTHVGAELVARDRRQRRVLDQPVHAREDRDRQRRMVGGGRRGLPRMGDRPERLGEPCPAAIVLARRRSGRPPRTHSGTSRRPSRRP